MKITSWIAAGALLALPAPAAATVIDVGAHGFEVSSTVAISAPPEKVYAALVRIDRWWSDGHSYSGNAANMRLDPHAGGCFCERLTDGGSVEHARVVMAQPGRTLRLRGALGPLQAEGADGALTWTLAMGKDGTQLTQTYVVGGHVRGEIGRWAGQVNLVLDEQLRRLERLVEQGAPEAR